MGSEVPPVQVTVSARHGQLDDAIQQQVKDKVSKLLTYFDRLISIAVTVDLQRDRGDNLKVEILAEAEHKHEFVAQEQGTDVLGALQLAMDRVKHQIKSYKEKIQDHRRNPSHNDLDGK